MKLKWLNNILVELPNIMPHVMKICWWSLHSLCVQMDEWVVSIEKTINLCGFVDGITLKPPLNFNFLFLNQQMHATYNCVVFINPLAWCGAIEPSSGRY
jgi:hypothetical protein